MIKSNLGGADTVWTVSALNFEVKTMLSQGIGTLWIEGEISNFACPASGHWYFTLKDERAQCRAAMFRGRNNRVGFLPKNGQQVLVRAQVTLYEARGEYQLVVDHLEDAGVGELMRRYEKLKQALEQEGLFDSVRKQPLPAQPRKIAIVTSPTAAALRDVLSVIQRRAPHIPVLIFPTQVQGEQAAQQVIAALRSVEKHAGCDVVLLVRGGGSLEDMWCFNDEALARAIAAFPIPVVTGIGHEIDFTIADFAADLRAPTPSAAAESITPDRYELMQGIDAQVRRLGRQMQQMLSHHKAQLLQQHKRLLSQHPQRQFHQLRLRLDFAYGSLLRLGRHRVQVDAHRLQICRSVMLASSPLRGIKRDQLALVQIQKRQLGSIRQVMLNARHQLAMASKSLDTLSPLKTLSRGFAKLSKGKQLVSSVTQLQAGDEVEITLQDGSKSANIK